MINGAEWFIGDGEIYCPSCWIAGVYEDAAKDADNVRRGVIYSAMHGWSTDTPEVGLIGEAIVRIREDRNAERVSGRRNGWNVLLEELRDGSMETVANMLDECGSAGMCESGCDHVDGMYCGGCEVAVCEPMRAEDVLTDFQRSYNDAVRLAYPDDESLTLEWDDIDADAVAYDWSQIASMGTFESAYAALPRVQYVNEEYAYPPNESVANFIAVWMPGRTIEHWPTRCDAQNRLRDYVNSVSDYRGSRYRQARWHSDTEEFADIVRRHAVTL